MIALDITRLLARIEAATPTGMDRVEFEYARMVLARRNLFVAQVAGQVFEVPRWLAEDLIAFLERRWNDGDESAAPPDTAIQVFRQRCRAIRPQHPNRKFFVEISRIRSLRKRRDYLRKNFNRQGFALSRSRARLLILNLLLRPEATAERELARQEMPRGRWMVVTPFKRITYLNVGHFGLEKQDFFAEMAKRPGLKLAFYLHDIMPITNPDLYPEGSAQEHVMRLRNVEKHADLVLANSEHTKAEIESRFAIRVSRVLHIGIVPLVALPEVRQRSGLVAIGTVEPRKNYEWLVQAWCRFADTYPDLVGNEILTIFGKPGWLDEGRMAALLEQVESHRSVEIVNGACDADVTARLINARAIISAAVNEGWGMPLGEGLSLGTPVVATDIAAHREVTQGVALFYPVGDTNGFDAALRLLFLGASENADPARFARWSWAVHFAGLDAAMETLWQRFDPRQSAPDTERSEYTADRREALHA